MSVASDLSTATTNCSSALDTLEAQIAVIEGDVAADPSAAYAGGGISQWLGPVQQRLYLIKVRLDQIKRS